MLLFLGNYVVLTNPIDLNDHLYVVFTTCSFLMFHSFPFFFFTSRPHDTPFEDGTFKLTIEFTEEYPNKPPTVRFVSKMFHPNVYADGGICLDILQNRWSPTYDVSAILTSIQVCLKFKHNIFHTKK